MLICSSVVISLDERLDAFPFLDGDIFFFAGGVIERAERRDFLDRVEGLL
jgi:hypothetical protein